MRREDRYQVVPYLFGQDALAASQSDVQLPAPMAEASDTVTGYTMPTDFQVLAVTADLSAAATAGSATVGATIDGTEDADTTLTITTSASNRKLVPRGKCTGVAGQVLGCELTTDGTWDGTSSDLLAVIYVLLDWGPSVAV